MRGAFPSRLHRAVDDYLKLRRTLGFKLFHETWWLPDFAAFLKRHRRNVITVDLALQWAMLPTGVDRSWWGRRLGSVRQFVSPPASLGTTSTEITGDQGTRGEKWRCPAWPRDTSRRVERMRAQVAKPEPSKYQRWMDEPVRS